MANWQAAEKAGAARRRPYASLLPSASSSYRPSGTVSWRNRLPSRSPMSSASNSAAVWLTRRRILQTNSPGPRSGLPRALSVSLPVVFRGLANKNHMVGSTVYFLYYLWRSAASRATDFRRRKSLVSFSSSLSTPRTKVDSSLPDNHGVNQGGVNRVLPVLSLEVGRSSEER